MTRNSNSILQKSVFFAIVGLGILTSGQTQIAAQNTGNQNNQQIKAQTDEFYEQGLALFRKEDYKKAIKLFEQSLKLNPDNQATLYNLGSAYFNNSQFTKSAKAYQEVLRLNPNHPTAKQDIADAQAKMKEEKQARASAWANLANALKNNRSAQRTTTPPRENNEESEESITTTNKAGITHQTQPELLNSNWRYLSITKTNGQTTNSTNGTSLRLEKAGNRWNIISNVSYGTGISMDASGTFEIQSNRLILTHGNGQLYGDFEAVWKADEQVLNLVEKSGWVIQMSYVGKLQTR